MLVHPKFTVPMQEGKFATISQQEMDAMAFFKYGIYKCRITNPNQVSTRLFQYSETKSYHTHFSLTTARELGLRITMADGKDNALLYPEGRLHGTKLFGPFVNCMMNVYEKVKKETKPRCKKIMNCLWGGLTQLSNTRVDLNKEKALDLQHREITHIEPFKEQYLVNLHDYRQRYKTDLRSAGPLFDLVRSAADVPHLQSRGGGRVPRAHGWGGAEQKGGFANGRWRRGVEGREGGTMRGGEREWSGVGMRFFKN